MLQSGVGAGPTQGEEPGLGGGARREMNVFYVSSPARTVKTAAKALNSCPQRRPAGEHAPTHSWRHRSRQLKHSRPMYMSSMTTDSHIMAEDQSETETEKNRETISREEQVLRPLKTTDVLTKERERDRCLDQ